MNNPTLRLIGDVHQKTDAYLKICKEAEVKGLKTVQLGDLGLNYDFMSQLDPDKHFFFPGNHDNYSIVNTCPNNLGDYGYIEEPGCLPFFFIRGAYSPDKAFRTPYVSWWPEEELNFKQWRSCLKLYEEVKPKLLLTHDCPNIMRDYLLANGHGFGPQIVIRSKTGDMLQYLFDVWKPELWIAGHWHCGEFTDINGCHFQILPELGYIDI